MKMKPFGKKIMAAVLILSAAAGCGKAASDPAAEPAPKAEAEGKTAAEAGNAAGEKEQVVILTAAAASLKYSFDEKLIPLFEEKYPWITVEASYDSSGKLQSQIEEGLAADVFMSAAEKQMDALAEEGLIDEESRADILENKIVLIVPETEENPGEITSFEDIVKAELIAVGDPESVPAGQYGKEVLESMGLWEEVSRKASYGTNVTEVLNWVAEGSAEAGIVYATDAAAEKGVRTVAAAPEGSLGTNVLYPAAVIKNTPHPDEAQLFLGFLKSEEAAACFEEYGFTPK